MLRTALPSDPQRLARLHEQLAAAAADSELLDIAYRIVDSPVGRLLLATTTGTR